MNTKIIKLDINRRLYDKIVAKQDDTGSRFLLFQLLDGAVPFNLTDRSVRVYGVKPDGAVIFNDLTVTHSATGFCLLELTNQMLAIAGTVKLELMITEGDKKLTSIPFEMEVIKKINSNDAVESSNEFRALLNALKEIDDWNKEFADKSGKLEELYTPRLNELGSQLDTIAYNFISLGGKANGENNTEIFKLVHDKLKDGDTLLLPPGIYYTDYIQFTKAINLEGRNAIIKLNNNQNSKLFEYLGVENFTINGVTFDGNKENNTTTEGHSLQLMNCKNSIIENTKCINHNGNGFRGINCENVIVDKSNFNNNNSVNGLFENSINCKFVNNECNNSGGFGLQLKGECLGCVIEKNNTHDNGREGINVIDGGKHNKIKNNNSYRNGDGGIVIGYDGVGGSTMPSDILVDGNTCYENRFDGININNTGMENFTIVNNECFNNNQANHATHKNGIFVANECKNVIIDNNILYDDQEVKTQAYGIFLGTGTRKCSIGKNNKIYDNRDGEVFESASGDCNNSIAPKSVMYNNILKNNSFENWSGLKTCDNWTSGGTGFDLAEEVATVKSGKAIKLIGGSTSGYIKQDIENINNYKGSRLKLSCWVYTTEIASARIRIYSYKGTVLYSGELNSKIGWERLTVERPILDDITSLYIRLEVLSNKTVIYDECILTQEFI